MPVVKELPLSEIETDLQVRHSLPDIQELADSIKQHGVLQYPGVQMGLTLLYSLLFGFRRLAAMKLLGWKTALFQVYEEPLTPNDVTIIRVVENLQRVDLSAYDQAVAVRSLHDDSGVELKRIATKVGKSPAWASRLMTPWRCPDEVQAAFKAGAIGITDCEAIAKASSLQEQLDMLAARLAHTATRDDLNRRTQRRRIKSDAVRVNRIHFPLPGGVTITLVGRGLAMDHAIDALVDATKAMRKGKAEGFDAKTFQTVMASKAKGQKDAQ